MEAPSKEKNPREFDHSPAGLDYEDLITVKELCSRLGITEKAIRRKMEKGTLIRGRHWFRPKGFRTMFSWSAIVATIIGDRPKDAFDGLHGR